jgi:hypothetical protein
MVQVYLTGAVSDFDDPFAWHDDISNDSRFEHHTFINPYTLNDFELGDDDVYERPHEVVEPALEAVSESDAMLVHWDDDAFLVGTAMEIMQAYASDVPVVVWYQGWRDKLSPWILYHTRGTFEDLDTAVKVALTFGGDEYIIKEAI